MNARFAVFLLFPVFAPSGSTDEVTLKNGKKLVGKIISETDEEITILTYKEGPLSVAAGEVKSTLKKPCLYDDFEKKRDESEDNAEGHFQLGEWCKGKGLLWQAAVEWGKAIDLDPDHEKARKALSHVKRKDRWVTYEEQMKEKGLALFEGKWLKPAEIEKIKFQRNPYYGWVLTATYKDDTDRAFLASWGERAREASKYMWRLTEGQVYVKEITVTDKGGKADFTIINKDAIKIGGGAYAATGADTITAPGKILAYTFFHELLHFKYKQAHCLNCKKCIMSSDPYADSICDEADHTSKDVTACWSLVRKLHKDLALKPLTRKFDPELRPVPETKVILVDR